MKIISVSFGFLLFLIALVVLNSALNLGINIDFVYESTLSLTFSFLLFLTMMPKLWDKFKAYFLLDNDVIKVGSLSITIGIMSNFAIECTRFIPLFFGGDAIHVASGQYTGKEDYPEYLNFLFSGLFTGFNEEFLFRFVTYVGLFMLLSHVLQPLPVDRANFFNNRQKNFRILSWIDRLNTGLFYQRKKSYLIGWILVISSLFALLHLPNITNFYMYFTGGLLTCILFLKFGFLSSVLAHAAYNTFSPMNHQLITDIFEILLK